MSLDRIFNKSVVSAESEKSAGVEFCSYFHELLKDSRENPETSMDAILSWPGFSCRSMVKTATCLNGDKRHGNNSDKLKKRNPKQRQKNGYTV